MIHPKRNLVGLFAAPRRAKTLGVLAVDMTLALLALYAVLALRFEDPRFYTRAPHGFFAVFATLAVSAPVVLVLCRIPKIRITSFDGRAMLRVALGAGALGLVVIAGSFQAQALIPRSVPFFFVALFFTTAVLVRVSVHLRVTPAFGPRPKVDRVAIYGAGSAGVALVSTLRQGGEVQPVFFVDDDPRLTGLAVAGLPVYPPRALRANIGRFGITRVLLAMPSAAPHRVKTVADSITGLGVEVRSLPSYVDIVAKGGYLGHRTVNPDALLGRAQVDLDDPNITGAYAGRSVLVTGAGGSIGSELCRQVLDCGPARVVLFDQSEFALYSILQEMEPLAAALGIGLVARLGSVNDARRVEHVLAEERVDTILHAAAYKHVPMVEENVVEGARANVLGTRTVALAAIAAQVERFVLISTDKAVRPTSVMGATKRLAELVIQDLATRSTATKFSMVRFGNVLGSSGSVLPLFQCQIMAGGPVTVTDPVMTRFFMTIQEAARLVLLAGSFSQGGDVFVLDMGKPMKIIDLARRMIEMSGCEVYDPETGRGDIRIEIIGLRPGEKLFEELLIDTDRRCPTPHPKILRARERRLSEFEMKAVIREISGAVEDQNPGRVRAVIEARLEDDRFANRRDRPRAEDLAYEGTGG